SQVKTVGLRLIGPRRIPAVVRDQGFLGGDPKRQEDLRSRSRKRLASQSWLRRRHHALRSENEKTCRHGQHLRRNDGSRLSELSRRHFPATLAARSAPRPDGSRRFHCVRSRVVALRLQRLAEVSNPEHPLRADRTLKLGATWSEK